MKIKTWRDLARAIAEMPDEQKGMPVQCLLPTPDETETQEIAQGIAIDSIDNFEIPACRSPYDNKRHGNDYVLLMDHNPYAEDGAVAYELTEKGEVPIYEKWGPTAKADQQER